MGGSTCRCASMSLCYRLQLCRLIATSSSASTTGSQLTFKIICKQIFVGQGCSFAEPSGFCFKIFSGKFRHCPVTQTNNFLITLSVAHKLSPVSISHVCYSVYVGGVASAFQECGWKHEHSGPTIILWISVLHSLLRHKAAKTHKTIST